ncbi:GntR family transcriptional regulator [Mangrovihabitans endophyticus]|uniref:GntR family transcriptional regulator n=1 Tax=Mangrovihabitans endophyticus TaxID=1751298 RepID=A0A8J3C0E0_9ACTN|nr:GntR family transcriptional regulator [Mangrovihabitans endophyticus]
MLSLIAGAVGDRSARGIAAAVSRLITAGSLPPGSRLPTVRDVARELGVSPTTVSEAWGSLTRAGAIRTRGRSGTFVAGPGRQRLRYAQLAAAAPGAARDLSTGVPDHDLLPDLAEALRRVGDGQLTTSYLDAPVLPGLETVLRARWPYPPARITVTDGALDALDRVAAVLVRFGDHVVVENPAFPPMLDLLDTLGAAVVGVPVDADGLLPDELAASLTEFAPAAVFLQPRAHNPTGAGMSARRAAELATVLAGFPDVMVVEDDHAGDIASAPAVSIGTHLSDRTVHVSSFSKSHGPDLRLAAVGGPATVVDAVADRRLLGPGWSSRLLQAVLLDLLTSPAAVARIAHARDEYARRRTCLVRALARHGLHAPAGDGINLWLPVADQHAAMLTLAGHGIAVAPGAPFFAGPSTGDHVRVTAGLVRDGFDELAAVLAAAAADPAAGGGARPPAHPRGWR